MFDIVAGHPGERERADVEAFEVRFAKAAGVANAAEAALVALTAEALAADLWAVEGIHTPVQWLMWRAGLGRASAVRVLQLARRVEELPTTVRLHAEGRLSLDQATVIARFVPAEFEDSVCELAVNATVPQLVAATRRYGFDLDRADREAAADADGRPSRGPERSVTYGCDDGDQWSARVRLPIDEGVVVQAALEAVRDRLHATERAAAVAAAEAEGRGARGTDAELGVAPVAAADALVELARGALVEEVAAGSDVCDVASRAGVLVHLEVPGPGTSDDRLATLHQGPVLPGPLRRLLLCDADVTVVWERNGVPVATCRSQRIVPHRLRRLVEHRDGGCVVPGCDSRTHLAAHHVVHWEHGGETVTANLALVCGRHHRLHHAGGLGITGDADVGLAFTDVRGRPLPPVGRPAPPRPTDLPVVAPYDGPTGERLQRDAVTFTRSRALAPASA